MGASWNAEDPDEGYGHFPKLIMAGRLTGTLDGRPVVIDANESGLVVTFSTCWAAWSSSRAVGSLLPVLGMLKQHRIPLRLSVAGLVTVEVLPRPSVLARMLAPCLSCLASTRTKARSAHGDE